MRVRSFLLLKDPVQADLDLRSADLSQPSDGVFIADGFPCEIVFGAFLELAVDPTETGEFAVNLLLSSVGVPLDRNEYRADLFEPLEDEPKMFRMPAASPGWSVPRTQWIPFSLELTLPEEVDVLLWPLVDNKLAAPRPLLFRSPPTLPPGL